MWIEICTSVQPILCPGRGRPLFCVSIAGRPAPQSPFLSPSFTSMRNIVVCMRQEEEEEDGRDGGREEKVRVLINHS